MNTIMKDQIEQLLQKHYQIGIHNFFKQPMNIRQPIFTTIFFDFLGKDDFETDNIRKSIDNLKTYISEDKDRESRIDTFMETYYWLQNKHIQEYPEIAINNVTLKALVYYIYITFGIEEPEILFYDINANRGLIENILFNFTGMRYNSENSTYETNIASHHRHKLCFPFLKIDKIDSIKGFMGMLKESIRQIDLQLKAYREKGMDSE